MVTITASDGRTASVTDSANVTSLTASGQTLTFTQDQNYNGNVASFTDSILGAVPEIYSASIDWGDGSDPTAGAITFDGDNGNFAVTGNHTYTSGGTFYPDVTITQGATPRADAYGEADVAGLAISPKPVLQSRRRQFLRHSGHFHR